MRCNRKVTTIDFSWWDDHPVEETRQRPTEWYCTTCFDGALKPPVEYAFTLTCSQSDGKTLEDMVKAVEYLAQYGLTNKPEERPCKFAYVVEHPTTNFHIHGIYATPSGRRIAAKYFKRAWRIWDERVPLGDGHRGGYHAKCVDPHQYQGYLEKEGVVVLR